MSKSPSIKILDLEIEKAVECRTLTEEEVKKISGGSGEDIHVTMPLDDDDPPSSPILC